MFRCTLLITCLLATQNLALHAEDPIFSGPQADEKLPEFKAIQLVGENKGEEFNIISEAGDKPVLVIFFHKLTRPAFGLTQLLLNYAQSNAEAPLVASVIVLSADPKEAMNLGALPYFPQDARVGVSPDGIEGPGAYGLNRNVELTVLVGKNGAVTHNFALVQPSTQADGPKILEAIADAIGQQPPDLEELESQMQSNNARMRGARRMEGQRSSTTDPPANRPAAGAQDEKLTALLRSLISNKQATPEESEKAIEEIEAYVAKQPRAKQDLLQRASRIVSAGVVERYGNDTVQAAIRKWAAELPKQDDNDN
ncbi:MAG: hypothetical protein NXI32_27455 [bacterium]|nr:hypothetical protein [bacterium]